VREMKTKRLYY